MTTNWQRFSGIYNLEFKILVLHYFNSEIYLDSNENVYILTIFL